MAVVYLLQMAPGKVGNPLHEAVGVALAVLFVLHHVLNWGWLRRLGSARNVRARLMLACDVALTLGVVGVTLTGMLMSRSVAPWAAVPSVAHLVRPLHGCCAYLGFMMVSLHAGMHVRVMRGYADVRAQTEPSRTRISVMGAAALGLGAWAFVRLGVMDKLTGRPSFPDAMTPLGMQLALHLALALPFVIAGMLVDELLRREGASAARQDQRG